VRRQHERRRRVTEEELRHLRRIVDALCLRHLRGLAGRIMTPALVSCRYSCLVTSVSARHYRKLSGLRQSALSLMSIPTGT
jgi:hypothetical protein